VIFSSILVDNILTAPVIAFVVALIATLLRFDLRIPDALYPILSTFLLLAIGIKGGKALSESSPAELWQPLLAALAIGVITPLVAYALFRKTAKLDITNAAALAAHYGSVSAVTFTVLISTLDSHGISYEGYVSGLLAVLEIVGIVVALLLAHKFSAETDWKSGLSEVIRGKSIAFLVAGLLIGLIVGPDRLAPTDPLFVGLFSGALTLFLVELGAIAANRLRDFNGAGIRVVILGIVVPLINGSIGAVLGSAAGMSVGGVAVMATLAASASYIAAPAAIRIALPEASPGIYVTASLGITFPFNLIVGIPLYIEIAELIA
jgi:hypothetical protein